MVSDREFFAWKQQNRSFAQLAAFAGGAVNLSGVDQAERLISVAKRVNQLPPDATFQFPAETVADSPGRMGIVSGD